MSLPDYAEYASELIEQIDSGELEPGEVDIRPFVEDDETVLTPELADRLEGTGKIEEYSRMVVERDKRDLREEQREESEQHQEALDALRDPETDDTETVQSGDIELTVKTYLSEDIERKFERLQANRNDARVQRRLLPEILAWLVEAPEEYTDETLWRAYAREYGRDELALVLMHALEPKAKRADEDEVVRKFRERFDR